MTTTILITGAGGSASANFIDSLRISKRDFKIVGCDMNKYFLALSSSIDSKYLVPRASDPTYIDTLNEIIDKEHVDVLHAQPDPEIPVLARNRAKLHARTYLPSCETLERCADKMYFNQIMRAADLPVPDAIPLAGSDAFDYAAELLQKHGKLWLRAIRGAGSKASLPVTNLDQARSWIQYWTDMKGLKQEDFMMSEFLPGKEFAFQSLWKDGQLVVSQARERMEYLYGFLTPSGQTSTPSIARTVHREDVNKIATAAIKAIDSQATGVYCADMKEDVRGIPRVTEINAGRFFTTSNFFAHAGCNMPLYTVMLALGESLPALPQYDAVAKDLYWVRMVDMGYKLLREEDFLKSDK